jgi:chaperonin GroES
MSTPIKGGFIPLFERILVLPDSVESKTETGIILSVDARKRPNTGVVISVGHLVSSNSGCPIKEGDRVLYQRYSGLDVQWDGANYHIIMANDLVAIINKDETTQFELKENA